jgi:hypothetical protein
VNVRAAGVAVQGISEDEAAGIPRCRGVPTGMDLICRFGMTDYMGGKAICLVKDTALAVFEVERELLIADL